MTGSRFIALWLISLAFLAGTSSVALPQGTDTVYDDAGVLTDSQEQQVQGAFDSAQEEAGQPIYTFLVPETGVNTPQNRQALLTREAREADAPQDAGVIMVAPKDRWDVAANLNGVSEDAVSNAMKPDFRNGDFTSGLIAGADEIRGEPATAQGNGAGGLLGGGLILLLVTVVGGLLLLRNRRTKRLRIEGERRSAEEEFAGLTTRLDEFDEKERLVSGYLEVQRPLLDRRTEEWLEARISDARTADFAREFNEAASRLTSDPVRAREQMVRGRNLLAGAMQNLHEAESTIDDYRSADDDLDDKLRAANKEILAAEQAEKTARAEGVAVEHTGLRTEYDRLAREAAGRSSRRDEFDPGQTLAAIEILAQQAREHEKALRDGISARDSLPEERHSAQGALGRARTALEEYRGAHERALGAFGQAALEEVPAPGELSSGLLEAEGHVERADLAASAGRFAEARSLPQEATALARNAMLAPSRLKAATAEADRKKREGEEKLKELEARLEQAKAHEHLMNPYQRQRLRDYEHQLQNARYGFFGGDWLTALLIFETLDNDYMGDPSSSDAGEWGGGDWGGSDWGGGDFGGGDF